MDITGTGVVIGLALAGTGVAGYVCWKSWNARMRKEMQDEIDNINEEPASTTGQMRKFLLGSEAFGFFYGHSMKEVRFFQQRTDGSKFECTFPVAALKTAAAAALLNAVAIGAQLPSIPDHQVNKYVHQLQLTLELHPTLQTTPEIKVGKVV